MAWTKPNFYLTSIFIIILIFVSLGIVGTDLINSDRIDLNEDSVDYILELKGVSSESGYEGISETDSAESNSKGILDSEDDQQVSDNNDFLSTLFIKKERASEPTNLFKLIYNIPTTLIMGLGLPVSDFQHVINILSYFLFIAILIMMWTKVIRT